MSGISCCQQCEDDELISVIVPIYNVVGYLDRCVESIVDQTYKNIEIILVDDGSSDGTEELCDIWAEKDKRVIVIHKENGGSSDARNIGIDIAKGKYIGFVDSDDYIEKDMYEMLHEHIADMDFVSCGICNEYNDSYNILGYSTELEIKMMNQKHAILFYFDEKNGDGGSNCNKLWKKELISEDRYIIGQRSEDLDFQWRLLKKATNACHISKTFYHYCHRENSTTTCDINESIFDLVSIVDKILIDVKNDYRFAVLKVVAYWGISYAYVLQKLYESVDENKYNDRILLLESELRKNFLLLLIAPIHWWTKVIVLGAALGKGKECKRIMNLMGNVLRKIWKK